MKASNFPRDFNPVSSLQAICLSLLAYVVYQYQAELGVVYASLSFAVAMAICLSWSFYRYKVEKVSWNGGRSTFGVLWERKGWTIFGTCYQEAVLGAPRAGDRLYLAHFHRL